MQRLYALHAECSNDSLLPEAVLLSARPSSAASAQHADHHDTNELTVSCGSLQ
jgi:hypothetical protein